MASKYQENGNGDTEKPLIVKHDADQTAHKEELVMVYLSTAVAVCGSYAFGTCVGYSSPTQFSIMDELNLSYSQYSVFGSILTIGAMLGAITAGRIADLLGRKGAMRLSSVICSAGWLAIYLAKLEELHLIALDLLVLLCLVLYHKVLVNQQLSHLCLTLWLGV
uniref:Sugar transporter ERD6-like 8 isoform X2 n=1 Tax=Nicotiana tabacum TaxID=4097 RepID=A0A1S4A8P2_TOBAC|nr:PREDICTED: sugar transporter ERD6-like 8 isoform X2 [Nicotiana tabacum]